ncbi:MAG TPA: hypothetical protein PLC59_08030 [Bacteroidales bacterium]|nr:hypothetical protein [Bacteroidales bacterium]HQI45990.1 hypothetical protein [Bacteroidales bacterium]
MRDKNGNVVQKERSNLLPDDIQAPIKLNLKKLRWFDRDYDEGGAYWGCPGRGMYVWCAWAMYFKPLDFWKDIMADKRMEVSGSLVRVLVKAVSREDAKEKVRAILPRATFFK